MKNNRAIQILTVIFALGVLTAYVMYSQAQQNANIMPGSKSKTLDLTTEATARQALAADTNNSTNGIVYTNRLPIAYSTSTVMMPSSKVIIIPSVTTTPTPAPADSSAAQAEFRKRMVAYSSKSAPAFVPSPTQTVEQAKTNPAPAAEFQTRMIAGGSKSAAVFVPSPTQAVAQPKTNSAPATATTNSTRSTPRNQ